MRKINGSFGVYLHSSSTHVVVLLPPHCKQPLQCSKPHRIIAHDSLTVLSSDVTHPATESLVGRKKYAEHIRDVVSCKHNRKLENADSSCLHSQVSTSIRIVAAVSCPTTCNMPYRNKQYQQAFNL